MKFIKLFILTLVLAVFSSFAQAEEIVSRKIISISKAPTGLTVEGFYRHNKNYKESYTIASFKKEFCSLNPQYTKKCTEKEFRRLPAGKTWNFPALPEAKIGKTIAQVYKQNEVYRVVFKSLSNFQQEVCENNQQIKNCGVVIKTIKTASDIKTTDRPQTYIFTGINSKEIIYQGKTYKKTKSGFYRLLT